jgi:acyl-CoA synthetase (AMP-forming)/AMP-acid ligase II
MEIEEVLMAHPKKLIVDVTVAGVSGGRTDDEKVPRAWIVLSEEGKVLGTSEAIKQLEAWHQNNLSRYKWLRGGIEVVNEVKFLVLCVLDMNFCNIQSVCLDT